MFQALAIHWSEGGADGFDGNGIDVQSQRHHAELVCFADRGPRAHERVENDLACMFAVAVELGGQVCLLGQDAAEQNASKH